MVVPALHLSSDLPLYEAIKRDIRSRIESGELPDGARILPEIELAKQRGVSRSTARKALQALEMEGLLSRTAGRGSFVRSPKDPEACAGMLGVDCLAFSVADLERHNHRGLCAQGFINTAVNSGYQALIHPPAASGNQGLEHLLALRPWRRAGWALWLEQGSEKHLQRLERFRAGGGALALVDRYVREQDYDFVVSRNEQMTYLLTRELVERGHTEIGLLASQPDCTTDEDRIAGYQRALGEAGLPMGEDLMTLGPAQGPEAYRMQILGMLGRRQRPTAVVCVSADYALCLLRELQRLAYTVPKDLELALVDDARFEDQVSFPVLTARQRSYEMGRIAAEMLLRRIREPKLPPQQRFLDFDLNFPPAL